MLLFHTVAHARAVGSAAGVTPHGHQSAPAKWEQSLERSVSQWVICSIVSLSWASQNEVITIRSTIHKYARETKNEFICRLELLDLWTTSTAIDIWIRRWRTNGAALRSAIWANWHTNTQWTLQKWLCKWFPNLLKRKLNRNNPNPPRELLYLQLWKTSHALCVHHQTCTKFVILKFEVIRAVWTKQN